MAVKGEDLTASMVAGFRSGDIDGAMFAALNASPTETQAALAFAVGALFAALERLQATDEWLTRRFK